MDLEKYVDEEVELFNIHFDEATRVLHINPLTLYREEDLDKTIVCKAREFSRILEEKFNLTEICNSILLEEPYDDEVVQRLEYTINSKKKAKEKYSTVTIKEALKGCLGVEKYKQHYHHAFLIHF